jgi:hypothetical protein
MFRLYRQAGKRRVTTAYSHSNYIRKIDVTVWHLVRREAHKNGVSVSRFVNYALWKFLTGDVPEETEVRPTSVMKLPKKKVKHESADGSVRP